jgi:hypothetical protein
MKSETMVKTRKVTVALSPKLFAEKLNQCLNEYDAPVNVRERAAVLAKLFDISKQQAWSYLEGHQLPEKFLLEQIANEFEVDVEWLSGQK